METAATVIKDALQEILVQATEQPLQAPDFQTALRYMNRMMASFDEGKGIRLGYTPATNTASVITIPEGAIEGLIFNLASRLATSYDIPVAPTLAISARDGLKSMRKIGLTFNPTKFPSTMPIGSGNDSYGSGQYFDKFYNPVIIPQDANKMIAGEINNFTADFNLFLISPEIISSFIAESNDNIEILSSSESNGVVTVSVKALNPFNNFTSVNSYASNKTALGTVCITATTSTGRVSIEVISFNISGAC